MQCVVIEYMRNVLGVKVRRRGKKREEEGIHPCSASVVWLHFTQVRKESALGREKRMPHPTCAYTHHKATLLGSFFLSQGANSTEFNEKPEEAAVVFMPEINADQMGGTMRLGGRTTLFRPYSGDAAASVTLAKQLYVHFTVQ